MSWLPTLSHYALQYYGIDWIITLTGFTAIFLLGDKKRGGFILGMIASFFGLIFSFQVGSIANGISSTVLFVLYGRGYMRWLRGDSLNCILRSSYFACMVRRAHHDMQSTMQFIIKHSKKLSSHEPSVFHFWME